jgi:hypothetical protein
MNRFSILPKITIAITSTILLLNFWIFPAGAQTNANNLIPTLVLLEPAHATAQNMANLQTQIEASGGHITHAFPHQAIIANLSNNFILTLSNMPAVAVVATQPLDLSSVDIYGSSARRLAGIWNSLINPPVAAADATLVAAQHPDDPQDALIAPDLPDNDGAELSANAAITPGYYQTSEFMTGSVAVGLVLVESNGSVDPSTENWTDDEKQLVFNEIVAGLNWWAQLEPRANLSFVYDDHLTNPLPTGVEPITRPYYHQQYWIADALGTLGYTASSYFTRVRDYNNHLRDIYHTDWAFTIFVVDSSVDSDNRFSDGYFAYAYLGGPFTVMTSGNNGYGSYNMDAVIAHEMGHIFHALDQYYNARNGCTLRSGYLNVENQNSQYGGCASNVASIMRSQVYPYQARALDPYAAGQIGWRDSDGDNVFDPLDTDLPVTIDTVAQEDDWITVSGTAGITPYPSPIFTSITINTLTGVQYRFDNQDWQPANAIDGTFNGTNETYNFTASIAGLTPGTHTLHVAALDSAGNVSADYATHSLIIFDPVDGGLNTELYQPDSSVTASQTSAVSGVAYHLAGSTVTNVEYRLDGGVWQPAIPQDGAFDSDYESFTVVVNLIDNDSVLLEARATAADGSVETNFAGEEISVASSQTHTTFLPIILNGM